MHQVLASCHSVIEPGIAATIAQWEELVTGCDGHREPALAPQLGLSGDDIEFAHAVLAIR